MKSIQKIILLVAITCCMSCEQNSDLVAQISVPGLEALEKIKQRGSIIILTTNSPTTYYYDRDNQLSGPEYDMTQAFVKSLNLEVKYKVYDSTKAVLQALRKNEGDIAAAGLTINNNRKKEFDYGPVYQKTNEYLVCHRGIKAIKNKKIIEGLEVVVAADSSYIESLKAHPNVSLKIDEALNTSRLLAKVAAKKVQCTVSDSTLYDIERRYHTEIINKFTLARESRLAWMLNKQNKQLLQSINDWFAVYESNNDLAHVLDKYYGYVEIFDYVDAHKFLKRVESRFPKYKKFFFDAAAKNEIQPFLLASQSYQESHWDRKAKSPTGVRGLMMLTQPTAKSLGVTNRLDAKENIYAGAKFHAKMKKIVDEVDEPDRSWLALAAYNIGRGHFHDAQSLARKLNKNPNRWHDMKDVLPLLSDKEFYKDLRYGYARGDEPVRYVMRIRNYDELLHQYFSKK